MALDPAMPGFCALQQLRQRLWQGARGPWAVLGLGSGLVPDRRIGPAQGLGLCVDSVFALFDSVALCVCMFLLGGWLQSVGVYGFVA